MSLVVERMGRLVDAEEVLAMFCGDCEYRAEPEDSRYCKDCEIKHKIFLAEDKTQQCTCENPCRCSY